MVGPVAPFLEVLPPGAGLLELEADHLGRDPRCPVFQEMRLRSTTEREPRKMEDDETSEVA